MNLVHNLVHIIFMNLVQFLVHGVTVHKAHGPCAQHVLFIYLFCPRPARGPPSACPPTPRATPKKLLFQNLNRCLNNLIKKHDVGPKK